MVRYEIRVIGLPVGTKKNKRDYLQEVVSGKPAELVRALIPMKNAQASF